MKKVDGKKSILDLSQKVYAKNDEAWKKGNEALHQRIRGNCWTVFRRLVFDYRSHFGNTEREKNRSLPFVDTNGWLHTSPALIAFAEGRAMGNRTISRWLDVLENDESKMIEGKPFILASKKLTHTHWKLKLNADFFYYKETPPEPDKEPKKPPEVSGGHIELSKLASKFNRKHHIR